jgi:hypothetical protein
MAAKKMIANEHKSQVSYGCQVTDHSATTRDDMLNKSNPLTQTSQLAQTLREKSSEVIIANLKELKSFKVPNVFRNQSCQFIVVQVKAVQPLQFIVGVRNWTKKLLKVQVQNSEELEFSPFGWKLTVDCTLFHPNRSEVNVLSKLNWKHASLVDVF